MAGGVTLLGHNNLLSPVRDTNGVTVRWMWGMAIRPISYPWGPNPWSVWRWVTLRFPATGPFVSVRFGSFVAYIGFKMFPTDPYPDKGHTWMRPGEGGRAYLAPSASVRL